MSFENHMNFPVLRIKFFFFLSVRACFGPLLAVSRCFFAIFFLFIYVLVVSAAGCLSALEVSFLWVRYIYLPRQPYNRRRVRVVVRFAGGVCASLSWSL